MTHPTVTRDQWLVERRALLAREKALTQLQDQIAEQRRALPWVRLRQDYALDTPAGPRRLAELFQGRRQLLVQHFMFGPGWAEGCKSCSYMADHLDAMTPHLAQRDIALLVVSRAPLAEIEPFRQRMGWRFPWASSHGSTFNQDFNVSFGPQDRVDGAVFYNYEMRPFPATEAPGISIFCKDEAGDVFHTYSTFGRGVEVMMGTYGLIDLTPRGRDEAELEYTMAWVRHHDRYEHAEAPAPASCCATRA